MLFRFLGLAFLEYCLFSLVCASPMKEYLKIVEDASSSSSLPKGRPSRFSPYQKHPNPISGTFRCPNGQAIDEKKIHKLLSTLFQTSWSILQIKNIKVKKLSIYSTYDTFRYSINPRGLLVQQSASEGPSTGYELDLNQVKKPPFERNFDGVFFNSGTIRQKCPFARLRVKPFDPSIFNERGKKVIDCNGVVFQLNYVQKSIVAAQNALEKRLVELQSNYDPKAKKGFPIQFESGIFTVEHTWMFPMLPGTNNGIYSVVITATGKPVGVVYSKTQEQYSEEAKRYMLWREKPAIHRYGACKVKQFISID